jgi:hypothetical protein
MTTKEVYEFYDEDKCREYEDELDNLKVIASNFSSYSCDRCPLTSICDSCFNEHTPCYWMKDDILNLEN